jgi:hypothetical protein
MYIHVHSTYMYLHTYGVHTPPSTIFVPTDLTYVLIIIIPSTECLNKLEHKHTRYKHHENEHTLLLYTELFDRVDHN